jgi:hypothetical protein
MHRVGGALHLHGVVNLSPAEQFLFHLPQKRSRDPCIAAIVGHRLMESLGITARRRAQLTERQASL